MFFTLVYAKLFYMFSILNYIVCAFTILNVFVAVTDFRIMPTIQQFVELEKTFFKNYHFFFDLFLLVGG